MRRFAAFTALTFALCLPSSAVVAQGESAASRATSEKITDRDHPEFVRCRTEPVIGSRAKKRKVCLTNREWEEFGRRGNEVARRTVGDNAGGMNGNN